MTSAEEGARRELEKMWAANEAPQVDSRIRLVLDPGRETAGVIRRLACLLKYAKRACGFRVVSVRMQGDDQRGATPQKGQAK